VPSGDGNVNGFYRTGYWRATPERAIGPPRFCVVSSANVSSVSAGLLAVGAIQKAEYRRIVLCFAY
jgi:hypothetical protein